MQTLVVIRMDDVESSAPEWYDAADKCEHPDFAPTYAKIRECKPVVMSTESYDRLVAVGASLPGWTGRAEFVQCEPDLSDHEDAQLVAVWLLGQSDELPRFYDRSGEPISLERFNELHARAAYHTVEDTHMVVEGKHVTVSTTWHGAYAPEDEHLLETFVFVGSLTPTEEHSWPTEEAARAGHARIVEGWRTKKELGSMEKVQQ